MAVDEWGIEIDEEVEEEVTAKKKKPDVWKTMLSSVDRTQPYASPEAIEMISPYMFARYLSNNIMTVFWAEELNAHHNIPKEYQYKFVRLSFPKNKVKYIRYPKFKADFDEKIIDYAKTEYKCGMEVALRYLNLMPEEEIEKLVSKYEDFGKMGKAKKK